MAIVRIIASDWIAQQLHAEALKENRTLSAMGAICLSESFGRSPREASLYCRSRKVDSHFARRIDRTMTTNIRLLAALNIAATPEEWMATVHGLCDQVERGHLIVRSDKDSIESLVLSESGRVALRAVTSARQTLLPIA